MKKLFYLIICFLLLRPIPVYAAPARYYLAVNDKQKVCGVYWPGDEFVQYDLPDEWRKYMDLGDLSKKVCTHTPSQSQSSFIKQCCIKLGYAYIEADNIAQKNKKLLMPYYDESIFSFYLRKVSLFFQKILLKSE